MPDWHSLPPELRVMILKQLTNHNNIAPYATVSEEWRTVIESENFAHLVLHPSYLDSLERLDERLKGFIKHICLNVELQRYTCRHCRQWESDTWSKANDDIMAAAITRLFSLLANWNRKQNTREGLTLELNAYSPSDQEHWHKVCYIGAPGEVKPKPLELELECQPCDGLTVAEIHDPDHGWLHGRMVKQPYDDALRRPFTETFCRSLEELPSVNAVTKFLLHRQCRRQLNPSTLSDLWSKLPRLEEIRYEPWQLFVGPFQSLWDEDYQEMIRRRLPPSVKKIIIFEDFNEHYLELFQSSRARNRALQPERVRTTRLEVAAAFASRSRQLESMSVAFMTDASEFLESCQPKWQWHRLRFLALTSRILCDKTTSLQINNLMEAAAGYALRMPELETMILWNGARGTACAFTWCRQGASLSCRATWEVELERSAVEAWKTVAYKKTSRELTVSREVLAHEIGSHGDAIHHLGLESLVVDNVSLCQIRKESERLRVAQL